MSGATPARASGLCVRTHEAPCAQCSRRLAQSPGRPTSRVAINSGASRPTCSRRRSLIATLDRRLTSFVGTHAALSAQRSCRLRPFTAHPARRGCMLHGCIKIQLPRHGTTFVSSHGPGANSGVSFLDTYHCQHTYLAVYMLVVSQRRKACTRDERVGGSISQTKGLGFRVRTASTSSPGKWWLRKRGSAPPPTPMHSARGAQPVLRAAAGDAPASGSLLSRGAACRHRCCSSPGQAPTTAAAAPGHTFMLFRILPYLAVICPHQPSSGAVHVIAMYW